MALTLLESPFTGFLLDGRLGSFSRLETEAREAVLRRWATHPVPALRKAFQAMKRLGSFLWYSSERNPLWMATGYPGADFRAAASPSIRVEPLAAGGSSLEADTVVVGSGAGGGVAAAELARRGLRVIVLEKGGFCPESELGMRKLEGMQKLYLDRGMITTSSSSNAPRHGRHRIDYRVSPCDKIYLLAGARQVATLQAGYNSAETAVPAAAEAFSARTDRLPNGAILPIYLSAHQMGTCRMGRSPSGAVADAQGPVFGARGLYIADAGGFPTNSMIPVMSRPDGFPSK